MKRVLYCILLSCTVFAYTPVAAQNYVRNAVVIDTPTAYTISRGSYQVSILGYDNGGLEFKTFIGLHDNLYLGISFDVQSAIGKDDAEPNVPGVIAKLKITDGWEMFPISIAFGYDSFYIGQQGKVYNNNTNEDDDVEYDENELNRMIYGPYFVITKPIYLFGDEQHVNFGMRVPTQPNYVPEDTSYFLSLDVPLGQYFVFKTETERIYYDFSRGREWLYNVGLRYQYLNNFGIEFDILFQREERAHRIIRIEYRDVF
ncbi:MAG TPA: hypothetical protein PLT75_15795 [Spirochaetota bacterium]|nr:hypothetical protein [Spirochaetota bacterium]